MYHAIPLRRLLHNILRITFFYSDFMTFLYEIETGYFNISLVYYLTKAGSFYIPL